MSLYLKRHKKKVASDLVPATPVHIPENTCQTSEVLRGSDKTVSYLAAVSLDAATCRGPSWSAHIYLWDLNGAASRSPVPLLSLLFTNVIG